MQNLFNRRIEYAIFLVFCMAIFSVNLYINFIKYHKFMQRGEHNVVAKVKLDYIKTNANGRSYRLLLLDNDEFKFYTTVSKNKAIKVGDILHLAVQNIDVSFTDYLRGTFYMPSYERINLSTRNDINLEQNLTNTHNPNLQPSLRQSLNERAIKFISSQHESPKISQLYSALFFGTAVFGELRDDVAHCGIAHLIAISGYHLSVIFGTLFLLMAPIYRVFSQHYAPYRNYKFDISIVAFGIIVFYFYLIGFISSFVRAFAMSMFGFYLICRGLKVLSFTTLFMICCFCIALFPSLALDIRFYFSIAGVFYIFLYLHHFKDKFNILMHSILLNFYVFFTMQVIILYFFPLISFQQFAVIPLSYAFIVFYPLTALLHAFGFGGVFDEYLLSLLNFRIGESSLEVSFLAFITYNIISLLAIKFKSLALFLALIGAATFGVLII
ncbi:ComEC/Rec2 family competence protein [Campylobacter sp. faydin G-105]|uniref:ComEC/Rec2 family competence protein n=1 Tax=Campylobacter anatolicus TaxID=2829105 RepID=UPI001B9C75E8|nr:ComEC/Rec2 family competence protein [Campylobacter anatolicus]MBR8462148.1 ComEC/Rec2 family competence protein [Campylobacter anatolicus]